MARVPSKHGRDQALDFEGFLNNLQDWELSVKDKDKKINQSIQKGKSAGVVDESRMETRKAPTVDYAENNFRKYDFLSKYNEVSRASNTEQNFVDASREKEQGNEYFKQKKFKEAIDCYSQSIALSPTAVAYANRAMAYLKIKRFQEAEDDCTEALNLDDRYIKAYSRRVTARKELGNLKEAMADAEFAGRLEPHNEEIKKQFAETKSLLEKAILQKASGSLQGSAQDTPKVGKSDTRAKAQVILSVSDTSSTGVATVQEHLKEYGGKGPVKSSVVLEEIDNNNIGAESRTEDAVESSDLGHVKRYRSARKQELKPSVQELASRAASRAMLEASRSITPPNTAYEFEASWRGFSGDYALQACLLKAISPTTLPQIFKNALTAPILVDIVKCIATFFTEEMELAISFLENLTKVPRFGMLIMCLSSTDKSDVNKIWYEVFCNKSTPIEYTEKLDILRSQYDSRR